MMLTNKQVLEYFNNLTFLIRENSIQELPAKISFTIIRNAKILEPIAADIMQIRQDIIKQNGTIVEGETYTISEDKRDYVNNELKSLLDTENKVSLLTFSLDDLQNCKVSLQEMNSLYFMIDGES